jgi:glucokinase
MILAGDIGGTKTLLALYDVMPTGLQQLAIESYASQRFSTFSDVMRQFSETHDISTVSDAVLGVAGPVVNNESTTTNLPWSISAQEVHAQFDIPNLRLINDLAATAYGMLNLADENFHWLQQGEPEDDEGNQAVIAAGTGLGEALLIKVNNNWQPIATEGGHCDFAPTTNQQDQLLAWLRKHHPDHVSYERILSGTGLYAIYQFLEDSGFAKPGVRMSARNEKEDPSAVITEAATDQQDPLSSEALRLFVEIYGAEAGNLALKTFATGGIMVGGGIAPKILPFMQKGVFIDQFRNKGRFKDLMSKIPVKVSLNPNTAILGAAYYGFHIPDVNNI